MAAQGQSHFTDYAGAVSNANAIQSAGNDIEEVFNLIDGKLNDLFGNSWESTASENSFTEYKKLRLNYQRFYNEMCNMVDQINNAKTATEVADMSVEKIITAAMNS